MMPLIQQREELIAKVKKLETVLDAQVELITDAKKEFWRAVEPKLDALLPAFAPHRDRELKIEADGPKIFIAVDRD
jgi:hypothetical protein